YSPDGTRIVHPFELPDGANAGLTGVSDAATGDLLYTLTGDLLTMVSTDNRVITVDGTPGAEQLLYWDISSAQAGAQLDSFPIEQKLETWTWADASPDFRYFLITDISDTTRLWDISSGQQITSAEN